jgi:hypothetical protein
MYLIIYGTVFELYHHFLYLPVFPLDNPDHANQIVVGRQIQIIAVKVQK